MSRFMSVNFHEGERALGFFFAVFLSWICASLFVFGVGYSAARAVKRGSTMTDSLDDWRPRLACPQSIHWRKPLQKTKRWSFPYPPEAAMIPAKQIVRDLEIDLGDLRLAGCASLLDLPTQKLFVKSSAQRRWRR